MKELLIGLVAVSALSAIQGPRTFTGTITDSECTNGDHTAMRMGPTDAECTLACIDAHGATYVLATGTMSYGLSDQQSPKQFAARRVTVVGTLDNDARTIHVTSIRAAD
jgi:hypothetical protein